MKEIIITGTAGFIGSRFNIVDVSPTVLSILDLSIPSDYDGKVIEGMFKSNGFYTKKTINPINRKKNRKRVYTQKETEQTEEKLEFLGYL